MTPERTWRLTEPLGKEVRTRRRGDGFRYIADNVSSSGSEHEGSELEGFVDGFFFLDNEDDALARGAGVREDDDAGSAAAGGEGVRSPTSAPVVAMVRDLLSPLRVFDSFERELASKVAKVVERLPGLQDNSRSAFRRTVVSSLRESGYDAGICKARWESSSGLTAGSYEYIDVLKESPASPPSPQIQQKQRYVVGLDFVEEFEVARPTSEYAQVSAELPRVYVGKPEALGRLLRLLADAAKRSLRARDMPVPPWRKGRYMQAKWLGSYRRTINPVPSDAPSATAEPPPPSFPLVRHMKCRFVGFHTATAPRVPPLGPG